MKRLICKWKNGYCNIPVDRAERIGDVVFAYRSGDFVGMFDLGSVELLYISDKEVET